MGKHAASRSKAESAADSHYVWPPRSPRRANYGSDYDSDYGSAPSVPDTNDSIHSYAPDSDIYSPNTSFGANTSLDEHDPRGQNMQVIRDLEAYGSAQKVGVASANRGIPDDFGTSSGGSSQMVMSRRSCARPSWRFGSYRIIHYGDGGTTVLADSRCFGEELAVGLAHRHTEALDFFHLLLNEHRAVAVVPTFEEEFAFPIASTVKRYMSVSGMGWSKVTMSVAPRTTIKNSDVQFRIKYGAVRLNGHENKLGREVFLVMVAQSRTEFLYQAKKMAAAVPSLKRLQGFMIVIIGDLGEGHDGLEFIPASSFDPGTRIECCMLSYERQEFVMFNHRAASAVGFQDWENDPNFMRWLDLIQPGSASPKTMPPDAFLTFNARMQSILTWHYLHQLKPQQWTKHPPLQTRSKDWGNVGADLMSMMHAASQQIAGGLSGIGGHGGKAFLGGGIGPYGEASQWRVQRVARALTLVPRSGSAEYKKQGWTDTTKLSIVSWITPMGKACRCRAAMPSHTHEGLISYFQQVFHFLYTYAYLHASNNAHLYSSGQVSGLTSASSYLLQDGSGGWIKPDLCLLIFLGAAAHVLVLLEVCVSQSAPNIMGKMEKLLGVTAQPALSMFFVFVRESKIKSPKLLTHVWERTWVHSKTRMATPSGLFKYKPARKGLGRRWGRGTTLQRTLVSEAGGFRQIIRTNDLTFAPAVYWRRGTARPAVDQVELDNLVLHGAARAYIVLAHPWDFHKVRRASIEKHALPRVLQDFVSLEISRDVGKPWVRSPYASRAAVARFRDELLKSQEVDLNTYPIAQQLKGRVTMKYVKSMVTHCVADVRMAVMTTAGDHLRDIVKGEPAVQGSGSYEYIKDTLRITNLRMSIQSSSSFAWMSSLTMSDDPLATDPCPHPMINLVLSLTEATALEAVLEQCPLADRILQSVLWCLWDSANAQGNWLGATGRAAPSTRSSTPSFPDDEGTGGVTGVEWEETGQPNAKEVTGTEDDAPPETNDYQSQQGTPRVARVIKQSPRNPNIIDVLTTLLEKLVKRRQAEQQSETPFLARLGSAVVANSLQECTTSLAGLLRDGDVGEGFFDDSLPSILQRCKRIERNGTTKFIAVMSGDLLEPRLVAHSCIGLRRPANLQPLPLEVYWLYLLDLGHQEKLPAGPELLELI
ncbi:uncharacterized protein B0H18DRAFT_961096 [Fomitopsis serialis]|uniref:uncharacterized protein n=1 Tax=Fomitopsis serialis TaxID=139415 RepID=UPI0020074CFB|nr:uncharacterized protein B0H18DRAFT_961096 [Neoantrodia serialis]KAH9912432.1 hypothetical protein B0H18DRAFT_961096 [Neoantrodia serialis]